MAEFHDEAEAPKSNVPKLYYWGLHGRAEAMRLAFTLAGIEFEDIRLEGPGWGKMKTSLLPTMPQANIPMLEIDGKMYSEAKACLRYVGTIANMVPSNPTDQLSMDEIISYSDNIFGCVGFAFSGASADEKKKTAEESAVKGGQLYSVLSNYETILKGCADGWVAGKNMSIADLWLFSLFSFLASPMFPFPSNFMEDFPTINAYRKKIGTIPAVQAKYADATGPYSSFKY